jgi:hypothetical protein
MTPTPPYEDGLGRATYRECVNCGFEYGNDHPDTALPTSSEEFLAEWKAKDKPLWMY